jgi:transcriptional regulator with XRE-family HTH domain
MPLGQRIKELRKEKKMTQEELGKILGVSKVSISGYENDTRQPDNESLVKLANFFNVTTDYLLGENNTPKWANKKDATDLKKFLENNDGSFTYGGDNLTEDEKQKLRIAMTQIFWDRHKHD